MIEKIENEWVDKKGNKLILKSIEGKWSKILKTTKEDRLFFIQINESEKFFIEHKQQIEIMIKILDNDIIESYFHKNCSKFEDAILSIKNKRLNNGSTKP